MVVMRVRMSDDVAKAFGVQPAHGRADSDHQQDYSSRTSLLMFQVSKRAHAQVRWAKALSVSHCSLIRLN